MKRFFILSVFLLGLILMTQTSFASSGPSISYISSWTVAVGDTVYVSGSNFNNNTYVVFDGASSNNQVLNVNFISSNLFTFVVPSGLSVGSHLLFVAEKGSSFPLSNSVSFNLVSKNNGPKIYSINPSSVIAGGTVNIYGSNFDNDSIIIFGDNLVIYPISKTFTDLKFIVPSSVGVGSYSVHVDQKASSLPSSNSVSIRVSSNPYLVSIKMENPSDNNVWTIGTKQTFKWSSTALGSSETGYIEFIGSSGRYKVADVSNNGFYTWNEVGKGLTASIPVGEYSVKIIIGGMADIVGPVDLVKSQSSVGGGGSMPADVDTQNPQENCLNLQSNLRYRMRDASGSDIFSLQDFLQAGNYLNSEPTGFFGILTLKAVKDFQQASGISPTGFVGSATRAKIKELSCK